MAEQVDINDLPEDLGKIATTLLEDKTGTQVGGRAVTAACSCSATHVALDASTSPVLGGQRRHQRGCLCCCCMRLLWLCEPASLGSPRKSSLATHRCPPRATPCRSLAARAPLPLPLPLLPAPPRLHLPPLHPALPRRPPPCPSLRRPQPPLLLPAPVPPPLPPPLLSLCPVPPRASERARRLASRRSFVQPCRPPRHSSPPRLAPALAHERHLAPSLSL